MRHKGEITNLTNVNIHSHYICLSKSLLFAIIQMSQRSNTVLSIHYISNSIQNIPFHMQYKYTIIFIQLGIKPKTDICIEMKSEQRSFQSTLDKLPMHSTYIWFYSIELGYGVKITARAFAACRIT